MLTLCCDVRSAMYASLASYCEPAFTVSPVEKLTNRTTGTLPVRSRYGRGTVVEYGRGTVMVWSRFGRGTVAVRSRYSLGTLPVHSWYGILKVRSRLVFSTRLEPGTLTVRLIVRIVQSRLSWIRFGHRYYTFNKEGIVPMV